MQVFAENPWFRTLPATEAQALLDASTPVKLGSGELVYRQGDPCRGRSGGFFGVVTGLIKLSILHADGNEAILTITSQQQAAAALLEAARAVAANTPVQLAAAEQTETQARARYNAGLATLIEVADAQSLLAQAEMQDQLARIDVWRALLAAAVAQGDLTRFLNLVRQP